MIWKYLVCFAFTVMITTSAETTNDTFPVECYVEKFLTFDIICPKSNITSLPTHPRPFIYKIYLPQNRIREIGNLSDFPQVSNLNLSYNLLTAFPWESLKYMKRLANLDLSHNQLAVVRVDIAMRHGLKYLGSVNVAFNKLTTFSGSDLGISERFEPKGSTLLNYFRTLLRVFIHGNPIHCDCRIAWLVAMAKEFSQCWPGKCTPDFKNGPLFLAFFEDVLKCTSPAKLTDVPLYNTYLPTCPIEQEQRTTKSYSYFGMTEKGCPALEKPTDDLKDCRASAIFIFKK